MGTRVLRCIRSPGRVSMGRNDWYKQMQNVPQVGAYDGKLQGSVHEVLNAE
jgi:hypothetical protein